MRNLIVVAHPDDEALWFTSVLSRTSCDVVCVTAGRDDIDRKLRTKAFGETMALFNVGEYKLLGHPDLPNRLDLRKLREDLAPFAEPEYHQVYTHGPYGDTLEHIHHQDVSYVVSQLFRNVRYTAWNLYPDIVNLLTPEEYHLKKYAIGTIYGEEYVHLKKTYELNAVEKFAELHAASIEAHYSDIVDCHRKGLSAKYGDSRVVRNSAYDVERYSMVASLVREANPTNILEFGAAEGILSDLLGTIAPVSCVEYEPEYTRTLRMKGYSGISNPNTAIFDVSVIAEFLEYIDDPQSFLTTIESTHVIVDITDSALSEKVFEVLSPKYRLVAERVVRGRWEQMSHMGKSEKLEIYRPAAHGYLFARA